MIDLRETSINTIKKHKLIGLENLPIAIFPHYAGFGIGNMPASICQWFGIPQFDVPPLSKTITTHLQDEYQNIIVLMVDGLHFQLFEEWLAQERCAEHNASNWRPMFDRMVFSPLTSIAPSTTSAALTTLWTGRLPAAHGIIGYELFLKEFGLIANMIFQSVAAFIGDNGSLLRAGFNPATFLPVDTLGTHLHAHGVNTYSFQHASIAQSGLSKMLLKHVISNAYNTPNDLFKNVENLLDFKSNEKKYIYIYWGDLDTHSHHFAPQNARVAAEWRNFAIILGHFLNNLDKKRASNTLFLLMADHGQITTTINDEFNLSHHPQLIKHLIMLPSGESRLPYLYTRKDAETPFREYLHNTWGDTFTMAPARTVLGSGLFGNGDVYQGTIDRLGEWVIFPKDNAYWWWVNKENHLLGRHGGFSEEEMLVPFSAISF